jgi:hypothetical protein
MTYMQELENRKAITAAYEAWVQDFWNEGWSPYFVNFMFSHIPHRREDVMLDEVDRVYRTLIRHDVRDPRSIAQQRWLARFIGCPDTPVHKRVKISVRDATLNEGLHFNGMFLISPNTRLNGGLVKHFKDNDRLYTGQGRALARIDVEPMTYGNMTDYALKSYKNARLDGSNILILPRSRSEMGFQDVKSPGGYGNRLKRE